MKSGNAAPWGDDDGGGNPRLIHRLFLLHCTPGSSFFSTARMEVTHDIFDATLRALSGELDACSFVGLDLEFSGLGVERPSHLDTPCMRYEAARRQSLHFPPIQCGLSLFRCASNTSNDTAARPDTNAGLWEVLPYNFQLFPSAVYAKRTAKYPVRDRIMHLQASTVDFLLKAGFDFHRCFEMGVSWLSPPDEQVVRDELLATYRTGGGFIPPADEHEKQVVKRFLTDVRGWCEKVGHRVGAVGTLVNIKGTSETRLIRAVEKELPNVYVKFIKDLDGRTVARVELTNTSTNATDEAETLCKTPKEWHEQDRKEAHTNHAMRLLANCVGFRKVADLLVEKRIPLVLHHGLLDMTKWIANFRQTLPESLSGFKRLLHADFPLIWDTRVMLAQLASTTPWLSDLLVCEKGRSIEGIIDEIHERMQPNTAPYFKIGNEHTGWADHYFGNAHEAGFDACEAGKLFLYIAALVVKKPMQQADVGNLHKHDTLKHLKNRIYLGSCGGYLDIAIEQVAQAGAASESEQERSVENSRNKWLARDDVVVIKGVVWDTEMELKVCEIPWSIYEKIIGILMKNSPFCVRKSLLLPCKNGTCVVVLKRKSKAPEAQLNGPAKKKQKLENGTTAIANGNHANHANSEQGERDERTERRIYDVIMNEKMDDVPITKKEINSLTTMARDMGLSITPYSDALYSNSDARRMRFLL